MQSHNIKNTKRRDQWMLVALFLFFLSHRSCDTASSVSSPQYSLKKKIKNNTPSSLRYFPHRCLLPFWVQIRIINVSTVNSYDTKNSTNMNSLFDGASWKTNGMFMWCLNNLLWETLHGLWCLKRHFHYLSVKTWCEQNHVPEVPDCHAVMSPASQDTVS